MQKVVWPTTIVQIESSNLLKLKNERSAMPVMMPGSASGSTKRKLMASRPKNAVLKIPKAAQDPRMTASPVAASAVLTERSSAVRTSGSFQVEANHLVLNPEMGQLSMFD